VKLKSSEKRDDAATYLLSGFDYRTIDVVETKLREGSVLSEHEMRQLGIMLEGVLLRCKQNKMLAVDEELESRVLRELVKENQ
jgi:hypothetical protein